MLTEKTRQALVDTKAILNQGWCVQAFARDKHGRPTSWRFEEATCFCLVGALGKALLKLDGNDADWNTIETALLMQLHLSSHPTAHSVSVFNDTRADVSEVIALIDATLEAG